ncbi:MAG: Eco57I restriction-modification methylase domain-containing protein [Acidiferrobacterales bacterium]
MAEQIQVAGEHIRLLDPSAGAGILICGAVETLASREQAPARIDVVAYEVDPDLVGPLETALDYLRRWCAEGYGVEVVAKVVEADFVLTHAEALRLMGGLIPYQSPDTGFDIVIANPPYFKIAKSDPRAVAASSVVHGQPNIYGLFMAVGAALLRQGGDFIFITPRSFASGPYFRVFREKFFAAIRPAEVHVFGSRRDAFSRDEVLQENIIFSGTRDDGWHHEKPAHCLCISSSKGVSDIGEPARRVIALEHALDMKSVDKVLRLAVSDEDDAVLELVDSWPGSLRAYGMNISTGPVVPFRATEFIDKEANVTNGHVPLLWMNHVQAMRVSWPIGKHKPEYIKNAATAILLPNRNYVLLRRFSAKEERRRLTAAPYLACEFYHTPFVGFENHLNYIHRPGGMLSEDEAWGLAALYNSALLDTYFRCISGNTQVSATELRAMPLPALDVITAIGKRVKSLDDPLAGLDDLVMQLVTNSEPKKAEMAIG